MNSMWKKFNQENMIEIPNGEPILIKRKGKNYWEVACFNKYFNCFDDEEADDYFCEKEEVELYMIVPDFEN